MDNVEQPSGGGGAGGSTKWIVGIIVLALVIWGLMAASKNKNQDSSGSMTKSEQTGPYKVGAIMPLTGDAAVLGEPMRNALILAAEEIKKNQAIDIELIIENGGCNGKDATNAAQKLVNVDKVKFIVGGACSGETLAAIPIAEPAKVLMVSTASTNPKLTGISPYFFRTAPSDNAQGDLDAQMATKQGYKKVAVLVEQTDYALGVFGAFDQAFKTLGGQTIKEEYKSESTDFRTQLTKLKAENPDALFLDTQSPTAAAKILKQMSDMDWKPKLFINETQTSETQFLMDNKEVLEGALGVEFRVDPQNSKFKTLQQNYKNRFGIDLAFANFAAGAYDALYIFIEGVKAVGYDGEKLAKWSRTIKDWQGSIGKITIKPDGDSLSAYSPAIVTNGKVELYTE